MHLDNALAHYSRQYVEVFENLWCIECSIRPIALTLSHWTFPLRNVKKLFKGNAVNDRNEFLSLIADFFNDIDKKLCSMYFETGYKGFVV
jgi:hypothetical protein